MKAAWYERKGAAADVLEIGELPMPQPGRGEVLVSVFALGVNPSDTKARGGARGNRAMPFPRVIPHQDGSGVIVAVGHGISLDSVGERVWLYEAQYHRPYGTAADYVAVPADKAVPLPDETTFAQGACLGVPAMTAHRRVFAEGRVEGRTVLVTGAAGAVGFYAVQFARLGGARVVATVGNGDQAVVAREAGAEFVVNRHDQDVVAQIQDWAGDRHCVDHIVEVALGANFKASLQLIRANGTIATYSSDAAPEPKLPFWPLVMSNVSIRFVLVYGMTQAAHEAAIQWINTALEKGRLKHRIGACSPLDQIAHAHELVEEGHGRGKVILELRP